ncbi:MAG: EI24 domain-containing protein [Pseudomonadota bacterium]
MAAIVAWVITLLAGWALFRGIAVAVLGLFADGVVAAVEARHYPVALESCRPVGAGRAILMGLASLGRLIGYNLLAVPLYIVVAATGIGLPVGFLLVNGWLLGRDLGDMVAARHIGPAAMQAWRSATRWPRFGVGLASAGLFAVPVVNLIAPVVGAAAMTHLFHRGRKP